MNRPRLIFVDCEAPFGVGAPSVGDMTEFGSVDFETRRTFYGRDCSREVFEDFGVWLGGLSLEAGGVRPLVFVSDNPAFDFQWINFYFWRYQGQNPFGHSARRIGDFAAGLSRNFWNASKWKSLRKTRHDHNPVNDAMGNVEAFAALLEQAKTAHGLALEQAWERVVSLYETPGSADWNRAIAACERILDTMRASGAGPS